MEKETTIIAYFSHLEDKIVVLHCRPFNPPGQPPQEGDVFINGSYLKKIIFEKTGQYEFLLPVNLLHYGSNHITFKWKYSMSPRDFGMKNDKGKYAVGFSSLTFQSQSKKDIKRKTLSQIKLNQKSRSPGIQIPQGGIVEYFLDVPGESELRFRLSSRQKQLQDPVFHLAVYSEMGKKIIRHFKNQQFSSKVHQINLSPIKNQTVKIVFTNSICNHPHFTVIRIRKVIF